MSDSLNLHAPQEFLDSTVDPTRPLIDEAQPLAVLRAEYENGSPSFVQQIDWLEGKGFHAIRRTRGAYIVGRLRAYPLTARSQVTATASTAVRVMTHPSSPSLGTSLP